MAARHVLLATSATALVASLYASGCGVGPVPPLGPLLDPANGAWAAVGHAELPARATANVTGLAQDVDVRYDDRGVPHIFAQSELDAYRALGYVVARDRLFQLDLQTRAASGRLSEMVGAVARFADREVHELGMPRAAMAKWRKLPADGFGRGLLEAYADGVNAYMEAIPKSAWPIEYRILNSRPERWEPVNSLHLFMRMSNILTYVPSEFDRIAAQAKVGRDAAMAIFPINTRVQEPIQPNGSTSPWYDTAAIAAPGAADTSALLKALVASTAAWRSADAGRSAHFASNSWAVAPRRTKNGYALLAGDPHLELTLPSIWYEVHLVVPGVLDVYGVTIPGAPAVVLGFNRDVAWSFTNTGADVLDYYIETVNDTLLPTQYRVDGVWKSVERDVQIIRDKRGKAISVDTLLYTHRGPLTRRGNVWLSMRWIPLEDPLDATGFVQAAKAKTARAYLDSMARYWPTPAQNMIAADRAGSIGIRSTGRFPYRADRGDGLTIRDGSNSSNDWQGNWPLTQYPQAFDPPQGYLASANQQPIDARLRTPYLGNSDGAEVWRALQINRLLRADSAVTPDAMRRYQTDPGSVRADLWIQALLNASSSSAEAPTPSLGSAANDASSPQAARALLAGWDRRYTKKNQHAILFETTLGNIVRLLWDELEDSAGRRVATPSGDVTLSLMRQPENGWWDLKATPNARENRDAVVSRALGEAYDTLVARLGPPSTERWRWARVRPAAIRHPLRLRGFSAESIAVQGGFGTLNPSAGTGYGSSWRMVVELGPNVRAWGTYPGGQSGNPASSRYRDRIATWSNGELDSLIVPAVPNDLTNPRHTLRLRPARD